MSFREPVFLRSAYNYDADAVSLETGWVCEGESLAQQQFAEDADINTIVKRFGLTGKLPDDFRMPVSGDFTGVTDFQSAMNAVRAAEEAFMEVPAEIRKRFANDPQQFMEFFSNEKNREEGLKLGLIKPPVEKTRDVVQAVDELSQKFTGATTQEIKKN